MRFVRNPFITKNPSPLWIILKSSNLNCNLQFRKMGSIVSVYRIDLDLPIWLKCLHWSIWTWRIFATFEWLISCCSISLTKHFCRCSEIKALFERLNINAFLASQWTRNRRIFSNETNQIYGKKISEAIPLCDLHYCIWVPPQCPIVALKYILIWHLLSQCAKLIDSECCSMIHIPHLLSLAVLCKCDPQITFWPFYLTS